MEKQKALEKIKGFLSDSGGDGGIHTGRRRPLFKGHGLNCSFARPQKGPEKKMLQP
ncbi:hypothetical protein LPN04_28290 [Rugamonas sp. A1-17]|nr:hypothetical protein [Rugamonas sp. A1-17]